MTKRKQVTADAIRVVAYNFWSDTRGARLQAILGDESRIDSIANVICLTPLLHHWWGLAIVGFEPLEKLPNGTRVRIRWLRKTSFTVKDSVPLDTNPNDHLHLPAIEGSFGIRDLRSGHPIPDGSIFDFTAESPAMEVSYELLELQWDLLRMAALCGAAEAANDDSWDPEGEDPVYEAQRELAELELEETGDMGFGTGAHG